jgi:hypothetical protein
MKIDVRQEGFTVGAQIYAQMQGLNNKDNAVTDRKGKFTPKASEKRPISHRYK